jgi:hypothetical protein
MNKDASYCILRIKQETVPWNWNQQSPALRNQRQQELHNKYIQDFYTVINTIIDCGGIICMDRSTLDSEYRILQNVIRVKIPNSEVQKIRNLPQLEKFDIDNRVS